MYRVYRLSEKEQGKITKLRFDGDVHYYDVFDSQEECDSEDARLARIEEECVQRKKAYLRSLIGSDSDKKFNASEQVLIEAIQEAERHVSGELELCLEEDGWYARDYREERGGSFPIDDNAYDGPLITRCDVEQLHVDVRACCDYCKVLYVG